MLSSQVVYVCLYVHELTSPVSNTTYACLSYLVRLLMYSVSSEKSRSVLLQMLLTSSQLSSPSWFLGYNCGADIIETYSRYK